jgi:hypothetical protein
VFCISSISLHTLFSPDYGNDSQNEENFVLPLFRSYTVWFCWSYRPLHFFQHPKLKHDQHIQDLLVSAVCAISGLNLLQLLIKAHFSKKSFWFELPVIVLLGCSSFISLVCLGYSQEWPSFAWVFVTYISVAASAIYLFQCKNGSVSDENQTRTVTDKVITAGLYLLKVLFMLIVSLLASGSILSAIASSYQPTGRPISVLFDGANRNGTLQIYCIGNSNISKPTIFIFSSSAHGIVDLYGLQYFLSTTNGTSRRVCIHDPLGFGWSQDPFDGQFTNYEYLYRLMLTSNESMPWHIVGWGGGGSAIMYLANNHTSSIKSVTFVE